MHLTAERGGRIREEKSFQDDIIDVLYNHAPGRLLLKPLVSPLVSRLAGRFLDTKCSRILIKPFIRRNGIRMDDYENKEYSSYNDFFKRRLAAGARRIDRAADCFVSPCDSRLSVCKIDEDSIFFIKHTRYTSGSLLRNRQLARRFAGGYAWVFRLCVDDYHRYIYVDDGITSKNVRIPGIFHTVNPIANDRFPIYKENTREYSLLRSEHFGTVLQMEVGAMLVGRIENRPGKKAVRRGEEKGNFAYGGSTVILMTQRGRVVPDKDILENSARGIETKVRLGEQIGTR